MNRFRDSGDASANREGGTAKIVPLSSARRYVDTLNLHPSTRDALRSAMVSYINAVAAYERGDIGICNLQLGLAERRIIDVAKGNGIVDAPTKSLLMWTASNLHVMRSSMPGDQQSFEEAGLRIIDPINRIMNWVSEGSDGGPQAPA